MAVTIAPDSPSVGGLIEAALSNALQASLPQADNVSLVYSARDDRGQLIGGVAGSTSYGWLLVKILWVHEDFRGAGIGEALMDAIESRAIEASCQCAWLDTSNPRAKSFYDRLGYVPFAELANASGQHPESHRRWFMKKALRHSHRRR